MQDEQGMRLALREAERALAEQEVPVGAVVVKGDELIAAAHNDCRATGDPTRHAECLALKAAYRALGSLEGCTLYVTLEPCAMCAGTLLQLRLERLVYGAFAPLTGCCGSKIDLCDHWFGGSAAVRGGVLEADCAALLSSFFGDLRAI